MSDSEDEVPLAQRAAHLSQPKANGGTCASGSSRWESDREQPLKDRAKRGAGSNETLPFRQNGKTVVAQYDDFDSDTEDVPLLAKKLQLKNPAVPAAKKAASSNGTADQRKRKAGVSNGKNSRGAASEGTPKRQRTVSRSSSKKEGQNDEDKEKKWDTLVHAGVLFPPEYEPHGVKMLYDGRPVDLTPEQEEVASMFAIMKETDYMNKETFLNNFWNDFKLFLGKNHVIQKLEKCDFTPIYEHLMKLREEKKNMLKEEKEKLKKEKDEKEAKYRFAVIDGRKEQVGNFRVEPPGLFRGRGEHPKMGKVKKRIYPRDITINIGEEGPIPEHPYPGQTWKEVRHDRTVTWLAYWKDPINPKEYKYVFMAANSTFKADSDLQKYEKARKLKDYIEDIRKNYEADWDSSSAQKRQMAVAMYFIDKLALRAGHEKDEEEADTVGCATLKVENVECMEPNQIKFDFLGKDSIRYENTVEVDLKVFRNVKDFRKRDVEGKPKRADDQLFDAFDAQDLNVHLKGLMDGLSVKVFRTYNASVTLDRLLNEGPSDSQTVEAKKADYDRANKEVAILCNHQRSVPKGHATSMQKLQDKIAAVQQEIEVMQQEMELLRKGRLKMEEGKRMPSLEGLESKLDKKKAQIERLKLNQSVRDDLKTVALGTSKINYMDPRITVAWCKRMDVPIEKVFNKSLLSKFYWAMEVEPDFRF